MRQTEQIHGQIQAAYAGDPWYGQPIRQVLDGVTARQAAARPIAGAHTIWEIVLHMTAWCSEVHRRLADGVARDPEEGDWPVVGEASETNWSSALARLGAAHERLAVAVRAFPESRLEEMVGDQRNPALGTGVSYAVTLHGLIQHDVYHLGQIALLKKALAM